MKEYKEQSALNGKKVIQWFDGNTNGPIVEGQVKTRKIPHPTELTEVPLLDANGVHQTGDEGELLYQYAPKMVDETYEPYAELIAAEAVGEVVIEWITDEDKAAEQAERARQAAKSERESKLMAMTYTVSGGGVIQCRPIDEQNMRGAIEQMNRLGQTERQWIGADNALVTVTPDDLRAAIDSGQDQAAAIYAEYMGAL